MRRAVVLVLLLTAPLSALPAAGTGAVCRDVEGLGPACEVEGGFEVVLADGTTLFTHGPDPLPSAAVAALGGAAPRDPPCVADPLRDYHAHFIYAHPADKPNRGAELTPAMRQMIAEANGLLYHEGAEFGAPVEYRFACDPDGQPTISIATIPVATGLGSYSVLVNMLMAQGFVNSHTKYWVWYDDPTACPCGGIAAAPLDKERTPGNAANVGPLFGATYGYFYSLIPMHENGHNLGVVADTAPDSSGAGHCNDGADIMCYADGGPTSRYNGAVCTDRMHFDCGHDTYFHPDAPEGTYLANRWQIAAPQDRFVQGCLYAEADILAPVAPLNTATVLLPPECAGHRYAIYGRMYGEPAHAATGQPAVRVYPNVFTLCWYDGAIEIACPTNKPWGHEGRVPVGATHALVTLVQGENPRFTLSVI